MTIFQLKTKITSLKEQIAEHEDAIAECRYKIERREEALFQIRSRRNN